MLLKEAPAWATIISNKSFDVAFLFTLPSLINTVLLVVAGSSLYSSPPATMMAGGLPNKGSLVNTNADDLKTFGCYHLTAECTPQYSFIIVIPIGNYILQIKTSDGGTNLQTRGFNNKVWSSWSK